MIVRTMHMWDNSLTLVPILRPVLMCLLSRTETSCYHSWQAWVRSGHGGEHGRGEGESEYKILIFLGISGEQQQQPDEFDMFAQSRLAYSNTGGSTYDDNLQEQAPSLSSAVHRQPQPEPTL